MDGQETFCRMPDALLCDREIEEGCSVIFDEKDLLQRPLGEDWTVHCGSRNTDVSAFVGWMQAARAGEKIEKVCPFCGGKGGVMSNRDGKTVIGCDSCDMRIELDVK